MEILILAVIAALAGGAYWFGRRTAPTIADPPVQPRPRPAPELPSNGTSDDTPTDVVEPGSEPAAEPEHAVFIGGREIDPNAQMNTAEPTAVIRLGPGEEHRFDVEVNVRPLASAAVRADADAKRDTRGTFYTVTPGVGRLHVDISDFGRGNELPTGHSEAFDVHIDKAGLVVVGDAETRGPYPHPASDNDMMTFLFPSADPARLRVPVVLERVGPVSGKAYLRIQWHIVTDEPLPGFRQVSRERPDIFYDAWNAIYLLEA